MKKQRKNKKNRTRTEHDTYATRMPYNSKTIIIPYYYNDSKKNKELR